DPIKRKKGIGKILMSATINRLCEFGANNVWLEVRISNNDAIEFYKKLGFAEEGIIPAYYSDFEDARMLKKIL
ncbi:MAG: GNAT family N-acetyltransferase, partial [Candidatus Hydrothermarchaeaceae archaeon]